MNAVILVGGLGTRLRPLTYDTCKAMMPVLNRPFLEHVFHYLRYHQIEDIILSLGYLPDQIQSYFGDGSKFGVRLSYVVENSPLGTAGAVKNAEQYLDQQAFLVLNGDIFTDIDLRMMLDFHRQNMAKATIALTPVDDISQYGVVETDPQRWVRRFVEKPSPGESTSNLINAGIYILEPELLSEIPPHSHYMFEHHLFPTLLEKGVPFYGFPSNGYWMDMGSPEKYLRLQSDLLNSKCSIDLCIEEKTQEHVHPSTQVEGAVIVGTDCIIGEEVQIKGPTVLGPGCRISDGAVIEGSILWRNVEVGQRAKLINCIIANDCVIGHECRLQEGTVLGSRVVVQSSTVPHS